MLVFGLLLLQSCTSDNKKAAPSVPVTSNTVVPETAQADTIPVPRETAGEKTAADPVKNDPKTNSTVAKEEKTPGPPGYITRENVFLQEAPQANSAKICPIKRYEIISILETKMTNEQGKYSDYPTWYRVELLNKKRGWVVGNSVSAGGGG